MQSLPRRRFVAAGVALAVAGCTGDSQRSTTAARATFTTELPESALRTALERIPGRVSDRPLESLSVFTVSPGNTDSAIRRFVEETGLDTANVAYHAEAAYSSDHRIVALSGSFPAERPTFPRSWTPAIHRSDGWFVAAARNRRRWSAGTHAVRDATAEPNQRLLSDLPPAATLAALADGWQINLDADPDPAQFRETLGEDAASALLYAGTARRGPEDSLPDTFAYGFGAPAAVPDAISTADLPGSVTTAVDDTGHVLVVERSREPPATTPGR
jgi:hypothetical protein